MKNNKLIVLLVTDGLVIVPYSEYGRYFSENW